ncbi:16S rRNA (adenine(1518)-N(6)/adenine(1519)-N(6))-dimethyltransferase RsmA [Campylobacter mucosalis]|uniref:16S rRNA (adenine(1518)-N(6)/adenine(1519)-N(6))- dimethyltransferase RsmA n=1 Tax=Campylobacter mucosalis TaxID=202 RepID=UPI0014706DEB|nr:16S rRNA (adenine(1518)-N(6)/adenine(1519)-N(6))-dimethyltransferase RsmA [Campylobacter mucosalis]
MVRAKKHFGQNFLKDSSVLDKIIKAIPKQTMPDFGGNVVEIGPGLGDLTLWLLNAKFNLISYEIDSDLIANLEKKFKNELDEGRFRLINKDAVLARQEQGSLRETPYILVANLPYYVATKMIIDALADSLCVCIIVMVQKEVAMKFACENGDLNALGILANLNAKSELLFDVSPECFSPAPKVVSSVLKIQKDKDLFEIFSNFNDYENFKEFLRVAFMAPRKTLFKNLSSKFDKSLTNLIFNELNLALNLRPHELNVALYLEIYNLIKAKNERKQREQN